MELRVLRYFLEAAREGNITHAAERLHISQPTLSKQLKELEGELGKKLFIRGNYNVRLTDEGMLLRKRAEDILEMVDKTEEEFKALGEITGGDIRIGCAESEGIRHLAQRIKAVQAQYPRIRVHLYSGDRSDLAERLEQGLLDFAVLVESNDLSKYNYLPCFQEKVDRLNIVATCNLAYNGGVLTREGLGCLLSFDKLTDTSPDSPLCFRPLMPTLRSKLFFVWKKYAVFSPAAEVLLNEMKDHCSAKEMQGPARMF